MFLERLSHPVCGQTLLRDEGAPSPSQSSARGTVGATPAGPPTELARLLSLENRTGLLLFLVCDLKLIVHTLVQVYWMCSLSTRSATNKLLCRHSLPERRHLLQPPVIVQLQLPRGIQWHQLRERYFRLIQPARGNYSCMSSFSHAAVQRLSPPVIETGPSTVFASLYQSVNFTCIVSGNPQPSITWFKDGVQIPQQMSSVLLIPEVGLSSRGTYHCMATNTQGSNMSADAYLNLRG